MLLLAVGPGTSPTVQFLARALVQFGTLPGQKPEPLSLGEFFTRTKPKCGDFSPGSNRTPGPFCGSYIFGYN